MKGSGGINGFVMVLSNRDRIDESIQQMLAEYEALFDVEFWNHLTIVITGVDDEDDLEEFEEEEHVTDIQELLKKKFKKLNRDIPVIPIGKKIYSKQVPLIIDTMPRQKFTNQKLKGPYELLKENYDRMVIDLAAIDHKLAVLQQDIAKEDLEITKRENEIKEIKSKLNRR